MGPLPGPRGSSGGSAAAVAGGAAPLALGTDTGGSVRQPAALCGLVGWKPTYGRVSRYGLVAFASSLDQAGALARTVEDAALAFELMAGPDPRDSTSLPGPVPALLPTLEEGARGVRVGLLAETESVEGGLHPDVGASFGRTAVALAKAGATVRRVSVPRVPLSVPVYYLVATAEASSNLARFDGVRYGARRGGETLSDLYRETRSAGFGPEVKRRILLGTFALSAGYHDAWYGRAQKVRALLSPGLRRSVPRGGRHPLPDVARAGVPARREDGDPLAMYLADVFTVPASLAGLPAISVPSGLSSAGLPIGMQFIGPAGSEPLLFRLARCVEATSGIAGSRPPAAVS